MPRGAASPYEPARLMEHGVPLPRKPEATPSRRYMQASEKVADGEGNAEVEVEAEGGGEAGAGTK